MNAWLATRPAAGVDLHGVCLPSFPAGCGSAQLPAVLGWAVVWTDNQLTGSWLDVAGLTVVIVVIVVVASVVVLVHVR